MPFLQAEVSDAWLPPFGFDNVTTWERYGEGDYLEIRPEPGDWAFGGAASDSPKIMDDALVRLDP